MHKTRNTEFGYVIGDLMKPLYIMQMARNKSWSLSAKYNAIYRLYVVCGQVQARASKMMLKIGEEMADG